MSSDPNHIITYVHHDAEVSTYVTGYDALGSFDHRLSYYGADVDQVKAVKRSSLTCKQLVRVRCFSASALMDDWMLDGNGERVPYHYTGGDCRCRLDRACQHGRTM